MQKKVVDDGLYFSQPTVCCKTRLQPQPNFALAASLACSQLICSVFLWPCAALLGAEAR